MIIITVTRLILGVRPANERRRCFVTTSLVFWEQEWYYPNSNVLTYWRRKKLPTFCRRHFQMYFFFNENVWIDVGISLKCVPMGPIDNKSALFQAVACLQTGDYPLPEQMMTQFKDVYIRHPVVNNGITVAGLAGIDILATSFDKWCLVYNLIFLISDGGWSSGLVGRKWIQVECIQDRALKSCLREENGASMNTSVDHTGVTHSPDFTCASPEMASLISPNVTSGCLRSSTGTGSLWPVTPSQSKV